MKTSSAKRVGGRFRLVVLGGLAGLVLAVSTAGVAATAGEGQGVESSRAIATLQSPQSAAAIATTPTIVHEHPASPILIPIDSLTLTVEARGIGDSGDVQLFWRAGGQEDWKSSNMPLVPPLFLYWGLIPGEDITQAGIDYYISATDGTPDNVAYWPGADSYFHLEATSDLPGLIRSVILGAKSSTLVADLDRNDGVDVGDLILSLQ